MDGQEPEGNIARVARRSNCSANAAVACAPLPSRIRVSIHAPAWGATIEGLWSKAHKAVSIHAPAWGATVAAQAPDPIAGVSIHAPAWGATFQRHLCFRYRWRFDPRARMGRDLSEASALRG